MFDRLIESETADLKPRSRYFVVSSVVVGLLFISAVIVSIYAGEIGLGNDQFELSTILAPPEITPTEPEPPRPQQAQQNNVRNSNDTPTRVIRQQPIDVPPVDMPPVSTTPNRYASLPPGPVRIDSVDSDGGKTATAGTGVGEPTSTLTNGSDTNVKPTEPEPVAPPPVVKRPQPVKHVSILNGLAVSLPKPPYPAVAVSTGIQGKVDVQVTIDETGKVISAKAASGHPFLRGPAENAAWKAKFTPTMLNGNPVKVTGVIVYNFTRN
jgi:protein TonB